jgi:glycosyltransferase involved in cell wall biosynthesis
MSDNHRQVSFVIPYFSRKPTGGVKIIYQYAERLLHWGCDVSICYCCTDALKKFHFPEPIRKMACRLLTAYFPRWYHLDRGIKKKCVFSIDDSSIPKGTDVVATAAETAAPVARLSPESGSKHYLIQDFELWALPELEVRATYRLGMSNIVVSDWLKRLVWDESGVEPTLIKDPIDDAVFYPEPGVARRPHEVACLYHELPNKGFADLWGALQIVKHDVPDLVVNAFGGPERPDWFPEWVRYTHSANQDQLRQIYSRSAVFACATVNEGFGLTLPESMFCGCALASTRFQGVWEYANEDVARLSDVHDPESLAANIVAMLRDSKGTAELAARGRTYAKGQCSVPKAREALRREFGIE